MGPTAAGGEPARNPLPLIPILTGACAYAYAAARSARPPPASIRRGSLVAALRAVYASHMALAVFITMPFVVLVYAVRDMYPEARALPRAGSAHLAAAAASNSS